MALNVRPPRETLQFEPASSHSLSRWARFVAVTLHGRLLRSLAGRDAAALLSTWFLIAGLRQ